MQNKKIITLLVTPLLISSLLLENTAYASDAEKVDVADTTLNIENSTSEDTIDTESNVSEDTFDYKVYREKTYLTKSKKYIKKYKKKEKNRISGLQGYVKTYMTTLETIDELTAKKRKQVHFLESVELTSDEKSEDMQKVNNKINLLIERINTKEIEKSETETKISLTKKRIKRLETKLAAREDIFRERIKQSRDTNPFATYLNVIFSGSTFSDMLMKYQMMKTISAEDNRIIEEYLAMEQSLNEEKILLNTTMIQLVTVIEDLSNLKKESEKELSKLTDDYSDLLEKVEKANSALNKIHKKIVSQKESQLELEHLLQREWDKVENYKVYTSKKIEELDETVAGLAAELLRIAEDNGIQIKVTEGFRSFEYQNQLYAQGRSNGGAIVTNARGGQSNHNYGIAFDVAFVNKDGEIVWDNLDQNENEKDDWTEIGELGESIGLEWGGRWTRFVDRPHFQLTGGKSIAELYEEHMGEKYIGSKKDDGTKDVPTVSDENTSDTSNENGKKKNKEDKMIDTGEE